MAEFGRGIKAGIIAGIIWGIVSVILSIVVAMIYWQAILGGTYGITVSTADMMGVIGFFLVTWIIAGIIGGIIFGLIFGLIYAAIYNSLPGHSSIMKAFILSLIGWLIFSLGLGYGNLAVDPMYYVVGSVIFGFISWAIWAVLLGFLWDRFGYPVAAGTRQPMYQQQTYQQPQMMYTHGQPPPQQPTPPPQTPPIQHTPPPQPQQPRAGQKFCPHCGAELQTKTKFCPGCGAQL